jgi:hypothetical protein
MKPRTIRQQQADKAVRDYLRGFRSAYDGFDDYVSRPEMQVEASDRFVNPCGFIDFRFKHMREENGRNERDRRCIIRKVKLK